MIAPKALMAAVGSAAAAVATGITAAASDGHVTAVELVVVVCGGLVAAAGVGAGTYAAPYRKIRTAPGIDTHA